MKVAQVGMEVEYRAALHDAIPYRKEIQSEGEEVPFDKARSLVAVVIAVTSALTVDLEVTDTQGNKHLKTSVLILDSADPMPVLGDNSFYCVQ